MKMQKEQTIQINVDERGLREKFRAQESRAPPVKTLGF